MVRDYSQANTSALAAPMKPKNGATVSPDWFAACSSARSMIAHRPDPGARSFVDATSKQTGGCRATRCVHKCARWHNKLRWF